jgi:IS30 family transposase
VYWYDVSHPRALERRTRARHHRRRNNRALYDYVAQRLRARWSPECIAGRLALDYPREPAMRVSAEAIYRWVFRDAQAGGELYRCLCLAHKRRRKQRLYGSLRGLIPGRVSIAERPAVVEARKRFGDWEGDTVYGRRTRICLLTQVERKSRYLIAAKILDRRAQSVAACKIAQFSALPKHWRRTLTLGTTARSSPPFNKSNRPPGCGCSSPIRTALGNAGPTRTPTGCCAVTSLSVMFQYVVYVHSD